MNNFLKYYLLRKSINYAAKSKWKNWVIVKVIYFLGLLLGYIVFFAFARDFIFNDHSWYWKVLFLILSILAILTIYKDVSDSFKKWKETTK